MLRLKDNTTKLKIHNYADFTGWNLKLSEVVDYIKNLTLDDIKGGENRLKFLLWLQQNKRDLYDGKEIDLKYLLSNPTAYNIDHVLPISISFISRLIAREYQWEISERLRRRMLSISFSDACIEG